MTKEHIGIYQCKAINDVNTVTTRAKFELSSNTKSIISGGTTTTAVISDQNNVLQEKLNEHKHKKNRKIIKIKNNKHKSTLEIEPSVVLPKPTKVFIEVPKEKCDDFNYDKKKFSSSITKTLDNTVNESTTVKILQSHNIIEDENDNIEIHEEIEEIRIKIYKELITESDIESFKLTDEVNEILNTIEAHKFGTGEITLRELATIGYLIKNGVTIKEITQLYNVDMFPALKIPESQSALVQLVERQGHETLISDILTEQNVDDENLFAATVGFSAFMRMIQISNYTIEDVIKNFKQEDFITQEWKCGSISTNNQTDIVSLSTKAITAAVSSATKVTTTMMDTLSTKEKLIETTESEYGIECHGIELLSTGI